ncbi:hypothetical protein [Aeromicrobium massiliense]|uniref:hypothetical protein n=1 Tax=Aeromicrobium massiliense TaxID=1464554 RepID=UPI0002DEC61E|nr:hypothetical protein [Aeromicrobium massiliense]
MAARLRWWVAVLLSLALPVLVWVVVGLASDGDVGPGRAIALAPAVGAALCLALAVTGPRPASPLLVVAAMGWAAVLVAFRWSDDGGTSIGLGAVMIGGLGVAAGFTLPAMLVPPRPSAPDPRGGEAGQPAAD